MTKNSDTPRVDLSDFDPVEFFKHLNVVQTPNEDGSCKADSCNGRVIKQVRGLSGGTLFFDIPQCEECGRTYLRARNVPEVVVKEFLESLNRPMTF